MFEEIPFALGFLVLSLLCSFVFFKLEYKPLKIAVQAFAIVGIIVHEISHVLMCLVTNTKINNVVLLQKVKSDRPTNRIYSGQVNLQPDPRISFLQALAVGLAPLFVSFWIFFFLYHQLFNPLTTDYMAIFYVFLMISLVLGSAPSRGDLQQITSAFTYDLGYTFYQLLLFATSIFTVWIIVTTQQIPIVHESINYVFFLIGYYVLKYFVKGVNRIVNRIFKNVDMETYKPIKYRRFRRLYHHEKADEKEAQW